MTAPNCTILPIANVPVKLIAYAAKQWQLCGKYAHKTSVGNSTNPFIKAISVWLILKQETSSGAIQNYRQQLPDLATRCKMSTRTLQTQLAWLRREKLVQMEGTTLQVGSYTLLKQYGINIKQRSQTILYDTENKATLAEMLIAIAVQQMQDRWRQVYWNKLTQNPDVYKSVYDLLVAIGANAEQLATDPEYFRQCHLEALVQSYQEEKPGQPAYDLLHTHCRANPDINCRETTYALYMGYTITDKEGDSYGVDKRSSSGFNHLKRRLAAKGLLLVEKDHIESQCRSRKDEKIYHHRWVPKNRNTIWFRCDQVTVQIKKILAPAFTA